MTFLRALAGIPLLFILVAAGGVCAAACIASLPLLFAYYAVTSLVHRWRLRRALRRTAEAARLLGERAQKGSEAFKAFADALHQQGGLIQPEQAATVHDDCVIPGTVAEKLENYGGVPSTPIGKELQRRVQPVHYGKLLDVREQISDDSRRR